MKRGIGGQKGETRNGVLTPAEPARRKRLLDWLAAADLASCPTSANHYFTAAIFLSRITVKI